MFFDVSFEGHQPVRAIGPFRSPLPDVLQEQQAIMGRYSGSRVLTVRAESASDALARAGAIILRGEEAAQ